MVQIDMAYAKSIVEAAEHGCTYEDRCLSVRDLFARHRIAGEKAGFLRGVKAGLEAAADKLDECCEPCFQCSQNILALAPQAIAKEKPDAQ